MKKQFQEQFQFVNESRKISAIEKLRQIRRGATNLPSIFEEESQKQNNYYLRTRPEEIINKFDNEQHQKIMLSDDHEAYHKISSQAENYYADDRSVRGKTHNFRNWSVENKSMDDEDEYFRFFYNNSSPPKMVRNSPREGMTRKQIQNLDKDTQPYEFTNDFETVNIINQKYKYDFIQINEKRLEQINGKTANMKNAQMEKEEENIFNATFNKFLKYKNLDLIQTINDRKMMEDDFVYELQNKEKLQKRNKLNELLLNKFIYKSVTKSLKNTEKDVEYFRDIGLPSRDLDKYSDHTTKNRKGQNSEPQQTKQQAHYLHLLRQNQLNINKTAINFDDVSNIAGGRLTCVNAYLCIRSEKITKAQYEKLLSKLDKYRKQQQEKEVDRKDEYVNTDQLDEFQQVNKKVVEKEDKNMVNQLINEIMDIRQTSSLIKIGGTKGKEDSNFHIKTSAFKRQKYTRMHSLLSKLYEQIIVDPVRYPISSIQDHIDHIEDILDPKYRNGKLLWFLLECYQEIIGNLQDEDNLRTTLKKKPINEPIINYYKNNKLQKTQHIRTTVLNSYTAGSKKTPVKLQSNVSGNKSPIKTPIKIQPNSQSKMRTTTNFRQKSVSPLNRR